MVSEMHLAKRLAVFWVACAALDLVGEGAVAANRSVPKVAGETPRNIIFILADDHRYDAMGFVGHRAARASLPVNTHTIIMSSITTTRYRKA